MKMYVVRDKESNAILLFKRRPKKVKNCYFNSVEWSTGDESDVIELDSNLFPEVTFENSPQEIELKILRGGVNMREIDFNRD